MPLPAPMTQPTNLATWFVIRKVFKKSKYATADGASGPDDGDGPDDGLRAPKYAVHRWQVVQSLDEYEGNGFHVSPRHITEHATLAEARAQVPVRRFRYPATEEDHPMTVETWL